MSIEDKEVTLSVPFLSLKYQAYVRIVYASET